MATPSAAPPAVVAPHVVAPPVLAPPVLAPSAPPRPTLSSQRKKMDSAPTSGFAARIDGATMADLVQLECLRGLTRAVKVTAGAVRGVLFFDQGQLVHAETGDLSGQPAALEVLSWEEGVVEASDKIWLHAPSIHVSWQGLLMLAAQRRDESERDLSEPALSAPSLPPHEGAFESFGNEEEQTLVYEPESGSKWKETDVVKPSDDGGEKGMREAPGPVGSEISREPSLSGTRPSRPANQNQGPSPVTNAAPTSAPARTGIFRRVRLDSEGVVLESDGEVGDFPDAAAYTVRLAQLIGEGLGLEDFIGFECVSAERVMITYTDEDQIVAVEAKPGMDLADLRKKAGV